MYKLWRSVNLSKETPSIHRGEKLVEIQIGYKVGDVALEILPLPSKKSYVWEPALHVDKFSEESRFR